MAGYAPWFVVVLKCARLAVKIIGMLTTEVSPAFVTDSQEDTARTCGRCRFLGNKKDNAKDQEMVLSKRLCAVVYSVYLLLRPNVQQQ